MPISLKAVTSTAPFVLESFSGSLAIASGASGDILTLTPAANKKVRLEVLVADVIQTGISIYRGSVKVVDNKDLQTAGGSTNLNAIIVGASQANFTTAGAGAHVLQVVEGKVNEVIRVVKESGSTSAIIKYSFSTGV